MSETNQKPDCLCGGEEFIVLACSGASDVGQVTDCVARKFKENKVRKMNCLAAVGAGIKPTVESLKKANLLIIDGCNVDCGKKIADNAGISEYNYVRITDLGYKKGETPITTEIINEIYERIESIY